MKTLHRYLLRQIMTSLFMTVAVFTFVLLLGSVIQEMLTLLVNRQATLGIIAEAIGLLIPFVLVFALPMGMLTAALLVFGRFSADQELTAARASGISLISLAAPVLWLSLALSGVSAAINLYAAPAARVAYKEVLFRVKVQMASAFLPERRFVKEVPGFIFYVRKNDGTNLTDVMLYKLEQSTNVQIKIRAPRGRFDVDPQTHQLRVRLMNFTGLHQEGGEWKAFSGAEWTSDPIDLTPVRTSRRVSLREMTFSQLRQELRDVEMQIGSVTVSTNGSGQTSVDNERETKAQRRDLTTPIRVQIHRQVAFSFACFGFTLIGIPLGIRIHRRETNVGFFVALALVMVYYGFLILASSLDTRPELAPHLIIWLPNFLFQVVGGVLLWRANRGL